MNDVCLACRKCCHGPTFEKSSVQLTPVEVESGQFPATAINPDGTLISLQDDEGYRCAFYDRMTAKCAIYAVRPAVCASFPLAPTLRGVGVDTFCPHPNELVPDRTPELEATIRQLVPLDVTDWSKVLFDIERIVDIGYKTYTPYFRAAATPYLMRERLHLSMLNAKKLIANSMYALFLRADPSDYEDGSEPHDLDDDV